MKLNVLPTYNQIFKEEKVTLSELLFDIPSSLVITLLSGISATLSAKDDLENQLRIYNIFSSRLTENQKNIIFDGIYPYVKLNENDLKLFSIWTCTEFIERELIEYRDIPSVPAKDIEFRILKAYILVSDEITNKVDSKNAFEIFGHSGVTWPLLIKQFEFNIRVDPIYQSIKSLLLFELLEKNPQTRQYVAKWINAHGRSSYWNYVLDFLNLCLIRYSKTDDNVGLNPFVILPTDDFELILKDLTYDFSEISAAISNDYIRVRDKPLFKVDGKYIVMNWDFLYHKIYNGLLFSFHRTSGIIEKHKYFTDFKSYIGTYFSEKILLRRILSGCFQRKHTVLNFDDDLKGFPDCYYRNGNNLFLFEFKDSFIPSSVIQNQNYQEIKNDIDLKFVANKANKPKGITQLVDHIRKLDSDKFSFDCLGKKIKIRNLRVFPIVIYTNPILSMSGINDYLSKKFTGNLEKIDLVGIRKENVKPLTLIDLEFFFRGLILFRDKEIKLEDLINNYHALCKKRIAQLHKNPSLEKYIDIRPSFLELSLPKVNTVIKRTDFIQTVFNHLRVLDNLPK